MQSRVSMLCTHHDSTESPVQRPKRYNNQLPDSEYLWFLFFKHKPGIPANYLVSTLHHRPLYVSLPMAIWWRRGKSRFGRRVPKVPSKVLNANVLGVIGDLSPPLVPGVRGYWPISISHFLSSNVDPGDSTSVNLGPSAARCADVRKQQTIATDMYVKKRALNENVSHLHGIQQRSSSF